MKLAGTRVTISALSDVAAGTQKAPGVKLSWQSPGGGPDDVALLELALEYRATQLAPVLGCQP